MSKNKQNSRFLRKKGKKSRIFGVFEDFAEGFFLFFELLLLILNPFKWFD